MSKVFSPMTLEKLSFNALFDFSTGSAKSIEQSIEQLSHLKNKEIISAGILVNRKRFGDEESRSALSNFCGIDLLQIQQNDCTNNLGGILSRLWLASLRMKVIKIENECKNILKSIPSSHKYNSAHPICQIIRAENVLESFYERKHEVLSLALPPTGFLCPKVPSQEKNCYYYDPLFFLELYHYPDYLNHENCSNYGKVDPIHLPPIHLPRMIDSFDTIRRTIGLSCTKIYVASFQSIDILEKNRSYIRKQIYHLVNASFYQMKYYSGLVGKRINRRSKISSCYSRVNGSKLRRLERKAERSPNPRLNKKIEWLRKSLVDPRKEEFVAASLDAIVALKDIIKCALILKRIITPMLNLIENY
ncbi:MULTISPECIES: hypothetical protein [Candidatus Ichthyocystis]|uniref:hypothetical protein n=1 Tax=Candidatus Ichthyocystis TaxID=2929841 RepID=UPI000B84E0B2|nr:MULTISPECIES: hypothetical protein [Ichthyocystis]